MFSSVKNSSVMNSEFDKNKRNDEYPLSSPCCYSVEEVRQRLFRTEADALAGRGLTMEKVEILSEKYCE